MYTNVCHCSSTYLDGLPTPDCDPDRPQSKDVWAFGLAQLFFVGFHRTLRRSLGALYEAFSLNLEPFITVAVKSSLDDRLDIVAQDAQYS